MCLSPIKIRNNSRSFEKGFSPLYREVPCGHCLECQQAVQNDWFVRLAYEWYDCKEKNGICFLLSFTYNDANRPFFNVTNDVCKILSTGLRRLANEDEEVSNRIFDFESRYNISAYDFRPFSHYHFSYKDLSKFMKSLRQIFDYKGIYHYEESETVKFFIASEYGHETKLPHYHGLFFLPFQISASDFMDCCRWAWSVSVKRADLPDFMVKVLENRKQLKNGITNFSTPNGKNWCDWYVKKNSSHVYVKNLRGFLSYSKKWSADLTSVQGLKYVVKYVSKKDDYIRQTKWLVLNDYLRLFPRNLDSLFGRFPKLCSYIVALRSYFPRVHSSNYLGIGILKQFECLTEEEIAKKCVTQSLVIEGEERYFPVPSYIVNRVMYCNDDVDNTLRKLTSIGVKVLRERLMLRVEEFEKDIDYIKSCLSQFVTNEELQGIQKECNITEMYPPVPYYLALYKYFFRDVELPDRNLFIEVEDVAIDTFCFGYFEKLLNRVYDKEPVPANIQPHAVKFRSQYTWNYQPCFSEYDKWLEYYSSLRSIVLERKAEKRKKEYLETQRLRKLYNEPLFVPF